jgi:hypothetical protein
MFMIVWWPERGANKSLPSRAEFMKALSYSNITYSPLHHGVGLRHRTNILSSRVYIIALCHYFKLNSFVGHDQKLRSMVSVRPVSPNELSIVVPLFILWLVEQLLGKDREISNYTVAIAK